MHHLHLRRFGRFFEIGAAMPADEDEMGYRRAGGAGKGGKERGRKGGKKEAGGMRVRADRQIGVAGEGRGGQGRQHAGSVTHYS